MVADTCCISEHSPPNSKVPVSVDCHSIHRISLLLLCSHCP